MTVGEAIKLTYNYAVECYGDNPKILEAYQNRDNYYFLYIWDEYNGEELTGPGLIGINKDNNEVFYVSSGDCGKVIYQSKKIPKKYYIHLISQLNN